MFGTNKLLPCSCASRHAMSHELRLQLCQQASQDSTMCRQLAPAVQLRSLQHPAFICQPLPHLRSVGWANAQGVEGGPAAIVSILKPSGGGEVDLQPRMP